MTITYPQGSGLASKPPCKTKFCFGLNKPQLWFSAGTLLIASGVLSSAFADGSKSPKVIDTILTHSIEYRNDKDDFKHKSEHHQLKLPKNSLTMGLSSPYVINVNKRTNKVYVANYGGTYDAMDGSLSIIDGKTNRTLNVVSAGDFPDGSAVNEKTNKIYVTNNMGGTVTVLDGRTTAFLISNDYLTKFMLLKIIPLNQ